MKDITTKTKRIEEKYVAFMLSLGYKNPREAFADLLCHYQKPHGTYHNWNHILESVAEMQTLYGNKIWLKKPEVMFAILYHDVIYDPQKKDNEEQSKKFAEGILKMTTATKRFIKKVGKLIMATRHTEKPKDQDEALIMDIDVSILGKLWKRFSEYEQQIRKEYEFVAWQDFVSGRTAILEMFLSRERIYSTEHFYQKYEIQARRNIKRSIALLQKTKHQP